MSDQTQQANGHGDDTLAGEFVLGVLSAERRADVQRRLVSDPEFAARVASWENRLAPLADDVAAVTPPVHVWARIEGALFGQRQSPSGWWHNIALWRRLAAGSSALAAASIAFLLIATPPQPAQPLIAALQASGAGPSYVARVEPSTGRLLITAVSATSDARRVPELWLIPEDGVPRSLGIIQPDGDTLVEIPQDMRGLAGPATTLAITLEPQGGAPDGKPTGPVIAAGLLRRF